MSGKRRFDYAWPTFVLHPAKIQVDGRWRWAATSSCNPHGLQYRPPSEANSNGTPFPKWTSKQDSAAITVTGQYDGTSRT